MPRGRPKKVVEEKKEKSLLEQLSALSDSEKAQVIALLQNKTDGTVASPVVKTEPERPAREIRPDEYITVMSLLPYTLILTTQPMGGGSVKRFTKFGETKRLLYSELVDIMENCQSFLEAGYFYIMDMDVIRKHGLNELYSNILTKEKMQEIVDSKSNNAVELYNSATPRQQETIIQMLVDKVKGDPQGTDMNIIDKLSRASGINIVETAEREKEIENTPEETEEK
jgi:hypothetical protein